MAKKKKPAKDKADDWQDEPFEESLAKLEGIVGELETGELGLADALERYEQGVQRLKHCHAQLEAAQRRIELLSGIDADGNPITEPFDDSPSEGASSRSKKRSAPKSSPPEEPGVDDSTRLF